MAKQCPQGKCSALKPPQVFCTLNSIYGKCFKTEKSQIVSDCFRHAVNNAFRHIVFTYIIWCASDAGRRRLTLSAMGCSFQTRRADDRNCVPGMGRLYVACCPNPIILFIISPFHALGKPGSRYIDDSAGIHGGYAIQNVYRCGLLPGISYRVVDTIAAWRRSNNQETYLICVTEIE